MAWQDRALGFVEERLGVTVVARDRVQALEENAQRFDQFKSEAEELAWWSMDYFSGRPQEMRAERRKRLAQRSRVALTWDPLAGAEADLRANFALGRGVAKPSAPDERVQKIIDEHWDDPVNQAKLYSFEAQRHRSNDLFTAANLFQTAFPGNGRVRLGFIDGDLVEDVVTDPEDDERPLFYVVHKKRADWDYEQDRPALDSTGVEGQPKKWYYAHWRNVEDAQQERAADRDEPLELPPEAKRAEGLVNHVRINRVGRTQFGVPPMARSLRFYTAMNALTEAHVAMAQARASFIAKRTVNGTPNQIVQSANSILSQTGELGATRFGESLHGIEHRGEAAPPPAASIWVENQSDRLESMNLSSGAAEAVQTAQIVRAPIAAAAGFGQHYLGDASNANLATATSLELPALMGIGAWQEMLESLIRWGVDVALEEAVRSGRLGGNDPKLREDADSPWYRAKHTSELRIQEDRAEMERRTGADLTYSFQMPYPGRRNLPDVTTSVTGVVTAYDPAGLNFKLRRAALRFLALHGWELEDPDAWVDEVLPEPKEGEDPTPYGYPASYGAPQPGDPNAAPPGTVEPGGTGQPTDAQPQNGARTRGTPPSGGDMGTGGAGAQEGAVVLLEEVVADVDQLFHEEVLEPLMAEAAKARNGSPEPAEA